MAVRFQLTQAVAVAGVRFKAGDIVTDTQPVGVAGDKYWPGLTATTMVPGMVPLEGFALSMKLASQYANEPAPTWITGADSIG
jgi:hypothetical protein